jgi:uracil-DNA glycosylase family 4
MESIGKTEATASRLERLYRDIYACDRCLRGPGCYMTPDEERVVRRVVTRTATSSLFLIGQALGPNTQRRSGLPYTYPVGVLSQTGQTLDRFVRKMGFTIDAMGTLPYAYSSDIVQRYPGRAANGRGDRFPTPREIDNCADWLRTELLILRPRVIILLGAQSARDFLPSHNRRGKIEWGAPYEVEIADNHAAAFPVYHPAYRRRNPDLVEQLYDRVAAEVRRVLEL